MARGRSPVVPRDAPDGDGSPCPWRGRPCPSLAERRGPAEPAPRLPFAACQRVAPAASWRLACCGKERAVAMETRWKIGRAAPRLRTRERSRADGLELLGEGAGPRGHEGNGRKARGWEQPEVRVVEERGGC